MDIFNLNLDFNFKFLTYGYSQWQLGNHRSSELQGSEIRGKIENQQRNTKVGFQGSGIRGQIQKQSIQGSCLSADLDFLHDLYLYLILFVFVFVFVFVC